LQHLPYRIACHRGAAGPLCVLSCRGLHNAAEPDVPILRHVQ
jgi:hypothetical protein